MIGGLDINGTRNSAARAFATTMVALKIRSEMARTGVVLFIAGNSMGRTVDRSQTAVNPTLIRFVDAGDGHGIVAILVGHCRRIGVEGKLLGHFVKALDHGAGATTECFRKARRFMV